VILRYRQRDRLPKVVGRLKIDGTDGASRSAPSDVAAGAVAHIELQRVGAGRDRADDHCKAAVAELVRQNDAKFEGRDTCGDPLPRYCTPGRPYVVFADDDPAPQLYNFNNSRAHIIGLRTPVAKLGVYADWVSGTTRIAPSTIELEYYDYRTPGGLLETDNRKDDPAAKRLLAALLTDVLPNELRAPLPRKFVPVQTLAKIEYLAYVKLLNLITTIEDTVAVLPITVGDV